MKGYAPSHVFVLSITGEGCQESGEIKVNNSGKCVCVCTLVLIAQQTSGPVCDTNTGASTTIVIIIVGAGNEREPRHTAVTAGGVTQTSLHNETRRDQKRR